MPGSEDDEREDAAAPQAPDGGAPVELSEDETAVMLGTFAGASFSELASSIGLPPPRLEAIVTRLTRLGLIEPQLIPLEPEAPQAAEDGLVGAARRRARRPGPAARRSRRHSEPRA